MHICKHFGTCGGCTYLNIPYQEELTQKEASLRTTLGQYGPLLEGLTPSPTPHSYRNKMELAFGDEAKDGRLALGIRKRRSFYEVATVEECTLIPDDFKQIALCVQEYFRQTSDTFFHRKRHIGTLRHLVLRRGEFTGEILINLSTTSKLETKLNPLITQLLALKLKGQIVGILHTLNDGVADAVKDENLHILWGQDHFHESICGLNFKVSAFSFFQTNSAGAEVLYGIIKEMATADKTETNTAYDLYCGTGTIAQVLSPSFNKIIGIEINPEAIKSAIAGAKLNNITNCQFHAGDVQALMDTPISKPDIAIVDPPRDGLHPKALAKLINLSPPKLIYVACKPASLARDLINLTIAGYKPARITGVDMFPRTPHVEAIALLHQMA